MTETEHLLACLSEEAGEIVQACAKALRFGMDDGYPGTARTNAEDIAQECTDLMAVLELLHERGEIKPLLDRARAEAKKVKVREFMEYSRQRGTLLPNDSGEPRPAAGRSAPPPGSESFFNQHTKGDRHE